MKLHTWRFMFTSIVNPFICRSRLQGEKICKMLIQAILLIVMTGGFSLRAQTVFSDERFVDNPEFPTELQMADLNQDGYLDILGTSYSAKEFYWYPNDGTGSYLNKIVIGSSEEEARLSVAADIDFDGDLDVVYAHSLKLDWYQNDGTGVFTGPLEVSAALENSSGYIKRVFVLDLDGDGDQDIIASIVSSKGFHVCYNQGNGTFAPVTIIENLFENYFIRSLIVQDLNGDALKDIIYSTSEGLPTYRLNLGDGQFGQAQILSFDGSNLLRLEVADMDEDNDLDIVVIDNDEQFGFANDGLGSFGPPIALNLGFGTPKFIISDVDNDGINDIFWKESNSIINYYRNLGNWEFDNPVPIETVHAETILSADLDMDGDQDLIAYISHPDNGNIGWYENNPSQTSASSEHNDLPINELGLFPNPSRDYLLIGSLPEDGACEISIIDVSGKTIMRNLEDRRNLRLDVEFLSSGIYFVYIKSSSGECYAGRFVKL